MGPLGFTSRFIKEMFGGKRRTASPPVVIIEDEEVFGAAAKALRIASVEFKKPENRPAVVSRGKSSKAHPGQSVRIIDRHENCLSGTLVIKCGNGSWIVDVSGKGLTRKKPKNILVVA